MENERRYRGNARAIRERKRRQRMRRIRNRVIIVACFALIIALVIWVFSACVKGCSNSCAGSSKRAVQTETKPSKNTSDNSSNKKSKTASDTDEFPTQPEFSFDKPEIEDNGTNGKYDGGLYIWNKNAFEMFYGTSDLAEIYANLMNKAAKTLGDDIKVYSMIVPNHTEFGLPERLKGSGGATTYSQADYIKAAYTAMNTEVTPVNVYNALSEHCNEYIYFSSDHHWTALGAYYAYASFMENVGKTPLSLDDCEENVIEGFTGSFLRLTEGGVKDDDVHFWTLPYNAPTTITDSAGSKANYDSPYYAYAEGGDYTYSLFLYGDNPLTVIKSSSDNTDDEKILVVHESYGNALIPYLTDNYSEVYAVDFRDWDGNIKDFCEQHDITNVLFLNGVMSSATTVQVDAMEKLLK